MAEPFQYTHMDTNEGSSHSVIASLVPRESRVLEFGCATGYMSRHLKETLGCTVTGVELFPEAAEQARPYCERVIVGDIETLDLDAAFGAERFDVVMFADVLEHLRNPRGVLARAAALLAEGGVVVASIPNVAHISVRLALLGGEFRYRRTGLLDETHLRFFTRETVQDLFESSGFVVTQWLRTHVALADAEVPLPIRPLPDGVLQWLAEDAEATTYQFIARAVRADQIELTRQARSERDAARADHQWLAKLHRASLELMEVVGRHGGVDKLILADLGQTGADLIRGPRIIPFLEKDGQYWGPPVNGETAISEVERLRNQGAKMLVIAWPAFWMLGVYPEFERSLRRSFSVVLESEHLVVFDLTAHDRVGA